MLPLPRLLRQENNSLLETAILVLSIVNWSFGRPVCSPHLCAGFLLFKAVPPPPPPSFLLPYSFLTHHSLTHSLTHHSSLITHHSSLITHHSSLITHHSSLITHHSPLITHSCKRHVNATKHSLQTALLEAAPLNALTHSRTQSLTHSSLIAQHSSLITHHSTLITHHSSLITHHSSLITHHSLIALSRLLCWMPRALSPNCSVRFPARFGAAALRKTANATKRPLQRALLDAAHVSGRPPSGRL